MHGAGTAPRFIKRLAKWLRRPNCANRTARGEGGSTVPACLSFLSSLSWLFHSTVVIETRGIAFTKHGDGIDGWCIGHGTHAPSADAFPEAKALFSRGLLLQAELEW